MKALIRATSWIDSSPVLLLVFTISTFGVLVGSWVVVMRWLEGKEAWAMLPFIALWTWGAWSTIRTMKNKKETRSAEVERLHAVVREVVPVGGALEEAIRASRARLGAEGQTRYRNLTPQGVSAEFDADSHMIRIFSIDGLVTGFDVT